MKTVLSSPTAALAPLTTRTSSPGDDLLEVDRPGMAQEDVDLRSGHEPFDLVGCSLIAPGGLASISACSTSDARAPGEAKTAS